MAVDKELLETLACPLCRSDLMIHNVKEKEYLRCTGCKKLFPVEENIPILLPDAALADPDR